MRLLLILPLLTACAHAPAELAAAKANVDNKLEYRYYRGFTKPDYFKPNQEKCTGFSKAYQAELKVQGIQSVRFLCVTPSGQSHMATQVGDWVLDNRYNYVVAFDEYDCNPTK